MSTVRLRRLTADSAKLHEYVRRHPRVRLLRAEGDPPERYQLEYRIKSLRMVGSDLQLVNSHLVEVVLPRNYPRTPPQCRMLSPVFHPNIAPHAICVGDHWGAGESLESIVIRIGEMLAYQSYNVKSPLNGEAARWVEQNKHRIPLDPVSLLPEEEQNGTVPKATAEILAPKPATPKPAAPKPSTEVPNQPQAKSNSHPQSAPTTSPGSIAAGQLKLRVNCPECATAYTVSAGLIGRTVRCQKCGRAFRCEAGGTTPTSQTSDA
jgi:predicted Zn finger-like uncharacterized protein